jgi:hypothetical protein
LESTSVGRVESSRPDIPLLEDLLFLPLKN